MAVSACPYILLNGNFHMASSSVFTISNRAFAYGDCIRETIHTCADRLCFFDMHLQHLREGMKAAMMAIPEKFLNKNGEFSREISKLITKNRVFRGSVITIMVFRADFTPKSISPDPIEYAVQCEALDELGFSLNSKGLKIGVVNKDLSMTASTLSNFHTSDNEILRVAIRKQCFKDRLDDVMIINNAGHIVETANNGNIFIIKGDTLHTPPLADGCRADVMRRVILEKVAPELGMTAVSDKPLLLTDLNNKVEEMFVASTRTGIQWVAAYKTLRFMRSKTTNILNKLSQLYESQQ
ncbi:MAG: aminotransferase class IV [Bacteroidales bacterium]|nr:aminotransferase class IV [Bacteroidales bacterium]